jgi:hypothetical protein
MIALILAPIVALASPPPPAATCAAPVTTRTVQTGSTRIQKLGDLPDADMELAVIRSVGGCSVREVTRFKVSQRSAIGMAVAIPTPGFRGELVPNGGDSRITKAGR